MLQEIKKAFFTLDTDKREMVFGEKNNARRQLRLSK